MERNAVDPRGHAALRELAERARAQGDVDAAQQLSDRAERVMPRAARAAPWRETLQALPTIRSSGSHLT
jgi:hypothetical protein